MRLLKKDIIATCLVAAAGVLYVLWAVDSTLPGMDGTRVTGTAILLLGFAASAAAVVPSFDSLIHGSTAYLTITGLIGLGALGAAIVMLVNGSGVALTVLMGAMLVLWLIASVHHGMLARPVSPAPDEAASPSASESRRPLGVG